MFRQIPRFSICILAVAMLLIGCGGGGDPSLTKAEFIKQADAICLKYNERISGEAAAYSRANAKRLSHLAPQAATGEMISAILPPAVQKETKALEAIGTPEGDNGEVDAFFVGIHEALKKTEENPESHEAISGNTFGEVDKLGREYGFKQCSSIP